MLVAEFLGILEKAGAPGLAACHAGCGLLRWANPLVGAIWDAAYAIYKIIVFVIQELEQLQALVTKVIQGVTALLNFDEEGVSQRVDQGLTAVVGILFKFLMGFLSLDQLPVWVAEAISALRNGVQNLLKNLLGALLGVGLRLLGAVGSVLPDDEQGRMTKKVAAKSDPSVTVWLQEQKNGDVVVMAEASKKEPLLKKLESQAGTSGQGCATSGGKPSAGILAKLNATETKGKVLKNEVRKAEKPPPKAKGPKVAKPKKQVQKQKKEAEKDLPALAEAAAQKKKATSGCGCGTAKNSGGGKSKGSKGGGTCIDIGTEVRFLGKRENLGQSRVGRRIKGEGKLPRKEPDCELMRLVGLELDYGDGNGLEAELLRGVDWLAENLAIEGSVLWLDLPEVGLSGWATVRTIEGCPGLEEGEGPLVTGWFKHRSGTVYDLVIAGEAKSIGITGTHPVWSVDRQDWVPAAELQKGERLLADDGSTPVVMSLSLRGSSEPVYNIEVEGDHCYRVGEQGLLVHNASTRACSTISFCSEDETKISDALKADLTSLRSTVYQALLADAQAAATAKGKTLDVGEFTKRLAGTVTFALGVLLTRSKTPSDRTIQCVWALSTTEKNSTGKDYQQRLGLGKAWGDPLGFATISPTPVTGESRWHAEAQIIQYAKNNNMNVCYIVVDRAPCTEGSAGAGEPPNKLCSVRVATLKGDKGNRCYQRPLQIIEL